MSDSKKDFTYRLQVLTHGPDKTLTRTLRSFQEYVSPQPDEWAFHADGPAGRKAAFAWEDRQGRKVWDASSNSWQNLGFCKSVDLAWRMAGATDCDYVFWLEHDFEFERPVDLGAAVALFEDPRLFQVSLMRDAVSPAERQAGGLYERNRRFMYEMPGPDPWLMHRLYFTTNPSLMSANVMERWSWLGDTDQCEGKFGMSLINYGYFFGVLGNGEPWVKHIGERNGKGY